MLTEGPDAEPPVSTFKYVGAIVNRIAAASADGLNGQQKVLEQSRFYYGAVWCDGNR